MEHLLHAHLQDDVRVRADPRAAGRHFTEQRIEAVPCPPVIERIDPDEDPVCLEQLRLELVRERLVEHGGRRMDTRERQLLEHAMEAVVHGRRRLACGPVATPHHHDLNLGLLAHSRHFSLSPRA